MSGMLERRARCAISAAPAGPAAWSAPPAARPQASAAERNEAVRAGFAGCRSRAAGSAIVVSRPRFSVADSINMAIAAHKGRVAHSAPIFAVSIAAFPRAIGEVACRPYGNGLPRTSAARSILTSTPMPLSAPSCSCSRLVSSGISPALCGLRSSA